LGLAVREIREPDKEQTEAILYFQQIHQLVVAVAVAVYQELVAQEDLEAAVL
jgi:hypothetical protein